MPGSLEYPDSESWHSKPEYSPSIAEQLTWAYSYLRRHGGSVRAFAHILLPLEHLVGAHMAVVQRERLYFLLGSASCAIGAYASAIAYYDAAIELASSERDFGDVAHLLSRRGLVCRAMGQYGTGSSNLRECLSLLPESPQEYSQDDLAFRLRALRQYADYEFYQGHFAAVTKILGEARAIIPLTSGQEIEKASCDWLEAHLYRLSRQPEQALHIATGVLDVIVDQANPTTRDRFHTFLANIALDMLDDASASPHSSHDHGCLALAQWHIKQALCAAEQAYDEPGAYLARLAKARYDRYANSNTNTLAAIEVVARAGQWLHDDALIAQAMTALGDELAARSEHESALNMYRQTIGHLDGSQASVLALPALRKVLIAEEWRTGH